MRSSSLITTGALVTATVAMATGCVPQDRYDNLMTANRSLQEQLAMAQSERDAARGDLRMVQGELSNAQYSNTDLRSKYSNLETSLDGMAVEQQDAMRRVARLEFGPLPIEVQTKIEDLALAHPRLLTFDARAGMVRFASDLTFDLGATVLKQEAESTINQLASVLNDAAASGLEVRVVGHTDNVPIGKPETRRAHPTNTHLSVHRAISVRDALVRAGINPERMQVAGYGEFRPVVANGRRGAAGNRRVEIYLVPMSDIAQSSAPPAIEMSEDRSSASVPTGIEPSK